MNIGEVKALVCSALEPLGVPVSYQRDDGPEYPSFSFCVRPDGGAAWGDGIPLGSAVRIQLDGWSLKSIADLNQAAKGRLLSVGCLYEGGRDLYEEDIGVHHRVQQFYYCKEE